MSKYLMPNKYPRGYRSHQNISNSTNERVRWNKIMRRVLLIHQAFATPMDAGGTRHYELIKRCVDDELNFLVVTSRNSYMNSVKLRCNLREVNKYMINGIDIRRSYAFPAHHKNYFWRVLAYLSFMITSFLSAIKLNSINLVWGTSPPIFQLFPAWIIAILRRCPLIIEVRDLWPDFPIEMGVLKNHSLIKMSRFIERFFYEKADVILVNSPAYKDYLININIPKSKVFLVANGVDTSQFKPDSRAESLRINWGVKDDFVVIYTGALGPANAIESILNASSHLQDRQDIVIVLAGAGKDESRLKKRAKEMELKNIRFIGSLPKSSIPDALAASDACIATLQDIPMFNTTYPNKVFDYMAAGRPTILAIGGVIAEVLRQSRGGIVVKPENAEAIAEAIKLLADSKELCNSMGSNARAYVEANFERDKQAKTLKDIIINAMKAN